MQDALPPHRAGEGFDAAGTRNHAHLSAPELSFLWHLARRLQACETLADAEAIAAEASAQSRSPTLAEAIAATVAPAVESLREREQLRSLVIRDPLTGLYNRRFMEEELARHVSHARRERLPLAVAMLDLDHFRDYNDRHGHLAGDLALQLLAVLLRGFRQGSDVPCRYGGEEFVLIMPGASAAQAAARLEPLLRRLAECGIHHEGRLLHPVTASIGLAEFPGDGVDASGLLDSADRAMYRAKRSGRNRICRATDGRV